MSLINDMLRDLEKGRHAPAAGPGERLRTSRLGLALSAGLGAFVLVSVFLLWFFWPHTAPEPREPAVVESAVKPPAPVETVSVPETAEVSSTLAMESEDEARASEETVATPIQESSEELSEAAYSIESSVNPETSMVWQRDLVRAEVALEDDRLTLPPHDSAYLYYQRVLAADSGNREALAGMERIARRYGELADAAMSAEQPARARRYWQLALRVVPDYTPATEALSALARAPDAPSPEASNEEREQAVEPDGRSEPAPADEEAAAILEEDAPADSHAVQLSVASREQQQVQRAQQLAAEGDTEAARRLLQALVDETDPAQSALLQARRTLLGFYQRAGDTAAAEALIADHLPEQAQACLRARLLVGDNRQAEALALLETARVARGEDEPCRALLAGLYHHAGQYASAQHHYQRLLERFGESARYWLGLALALDAQQSYSAARVAYQRVLQSRDMTPALQTFARDRLAQLND